MARKKIKKTEKNVKRYLNPRVAFVISCLYFVSFVLSPIKYDILQTSIISRISNALFILSLVVSSMTLLEIVFNKFSGKKLAIISLLVPVSTFIYLLINSLIENNYFLLYMFICTIICLIYNLVFFKIKKARFIKKFPIITYTIYVLILLAIYMFVLLSYKFFYSGDYVVNMVNFKEYTKAFLSTYGYTYLIVYSVMHMGIISILMFNIFTRISKKN